MSSIAATQRWSEWTPARADEVELATRDLASEAAATPYAAAPAAATPAAAAPGSVGIAGMLATLSSDALRLAITDIDPSVLGTALDGLGEPHVRSVIRTATGGFDSEGLLATMDDAMTELSSRILDGTIVDTSLHDSIAALHRLTSRVEAEKLRRIGEMSGRQSHVADSARTTVDLLTRFGLTRGEARTEVETAAALADMPQASAKMASGDLSARQANDLARKRREMEDLATGAGADAEAIAAQRDLLDSAVARTPAGTDRNRFRDQLDDVAAKHRPDQLAERERRAHRNRRLTITPGKDGSARIDGYGPAAVIAKFSAMLDALARPTTAQDPRSQQQRNFDALEHLSERYLAEGQLPEVAAQQPHIIVTVPRAALDEEPGADAAHLDGFGNISNDTARMLACDAEITFLISGDHGEPLSIGRSSRNPTAAQRRATIARDRSCVGCGAPASRCQVHHIRYWRNGGQTDIQNLTLLCWNCHTHVHHHGWRITRDDDGRHHAGPEGQRPGRYIDQQPNARERGRQRR